MADVRPLLEADDRGLADWLRGRKRDDTAFLLAIDQFEELFTFAEKEERRSFDRLLATALDDADVPLVRHLHRPCRLPRPLRGPAAARQTCATASPGPGPCRLSATEACARSSTARHASPTWM